MLVWLLAVLAFGLYVMTPEERVRLARAALAAGRRLRDAAVNDPPGCEPFRDALRARTRWPIVTLAFIAANAGLFILVLFGPGRLGDPNTLVGWGASTGPRTTNGEWWRVVSASFVHSGMVPLVVNLVALFQLGLILERLVGHVAFAAVYVAAAAFASFESIAAQAVAVSSGASGAVFGLYGLLLTCWAWTLLRPSAVTVPLVAAKKIAAVAAVFVLFNLVNPSLDRAAEIAGLATGLACGALVVRGVAERKPPARRVAAVAIAAAGIAFSTAAPLAGIVDVRPVIDRVVAAEARTAGTYQAAVDRFHLGRISAASMAQLIDRTILPDLRASHLCLQRALAGKVPPSQQPLVAGAREYFHLRDESWRLRARALASADMTMLRRADATEHLALAALERITPTEVH